MENSHLGPASDPVLPHVDQEIKLVLEAALTLLLSLVERIVLESHLKYDFAKLENVQVSDVVVSLSTSSS